MFNNPSSQGSTPGPLLFLIYFWYINDIKSSNVLKFTLFAADTNITLSLSPSNVNNDAHTSPIFKDLGILKVHDLYLLECLKFMYDQVHSQSNKILVISRAFDVHHTYARGRWNLRPMLPKLEIQKRFVTCFGCKKWNELPDNLR